MTELESIFTRLGLARYIDSFIEEGFETWETVLDITESDLDALNVKLGHRRRLQREIANTRGKTFDQTSAQDLQAVLNDEKRSFGTDEDPDARKGGKKPLTVRHGKRKYRRHPKPDENAPARPPSAYVIFSNTIREELKPLNLSFTDIAKRVGESWQILSSEEKEHYESRAAADKDRYNAEMAKYKKTAQYQEYATYLTDFKMKNADGKRAKLDSESEASVVSNVDLNIATEYRPNSQQVSSPWIGSMPPPKSTKKSVSKAESSSPSSHSSTPPPHHSSITVNSGGEAATAVGIYSPVQRPLYRGKDHMHDSPLPRIRIPESREPSMMKGGLPPLPADALLHNNSSSRTNSRRTHTIPASLLRHDTSRSSRSSRSSNLSSDNTSPSMSFSTDLNAEDVRIQRALPLPSPLKSDLFGASQYRDPSHLILDISNPPLLNERAVPQTLQQTEHVPLSSTDIPQERRSLMNLSIASLKASPRPEIRSHLHEQNKSQLTTDSENQLSQARALSAPQELQHLPDTASSERQSATMKSEERSRERSLQSPQDLLSVLADAGRLVDRESQKLP